ncbi:murein transglycosylase A [Rhodovarius crocodyli]
MADDAMLGGIGPGGTPGRWREFCSELAVTPPSGLQRLIERRLVAIDQGDGRMTGYYEPMLRGSRTRSAAYPVPLLRRPDATGQLPSRAQIDAGALSGRGLELLYVDSEEDLFFLQIQGSGRVQLENGDIVRVSYAGSNGHPYVAVGRLLIERGEVPREQMSMQAIRGWMRRSGHRAALDLMHRNPSYIFFREVTGSSADAGPPGTLGAPLTPGRSVAVDRDFVPLGVPVFLVPEGGVGPRIAAAQDTGGAIRGQARADFFTGWGDVAGEQAGTMNQPLRLFVLVPR